MLGRLPEFLHLRFPTAFTRTMAYYAVANGRKVGIWESWGMCKEQVDGYPNAKYKKFKIQQEAEDFVRKNAGERAKEFFNEYKKTKIVEPNQEADSQNDYWPESDNDDFDKSILQDEDLLKAIYEVEGFPDKSLKRKAPTEASSSSKLPKYSSKIIQVSGYMNAGEYEFPIDDEGFVICYTDGSCINNGKANAIAGFGVFFGHDHPLNCSKPVTGRVTNNVGEIQAAVHALQIARDFGIKKLCICTDSQFLINAVTIWFSGWKRKNWHLKNGEPVKNAMDFKVLDLLLSDKQVTVKWNYVKGHDKIEGNEMADKLARDGAAEYGRLHLPNANK